ncbi:hypothetical protein CALVIDRAFT_336778 [Calocera viscosa TUFC12733]|uniref:Uncharacterized protein n=1 Tax=Calocera viscosa (strain TUFC12733) TaxID=1330018 RepID=A0A167HIX8_CALVF|nr:hypothetical protein CALVIDRAFT_336778 [Calocera viscosa TUFC12733]
MRGFVVTITLLVTRHMRMVLSSSMMNRSLQLGSEIFDGPYHRLSIRWTLLPLLDASASGVSGGVSYLRSREEMIRKTGRGYGLVTTMVDQNIAAKQYNRRLSHRVECGRMTDDQR